MWYLMLNWVQAFKEDYDDVLDDVVVRSKFGVEFTLLQINGGDDLLIDKGVSVVQLSHDALSVAKDLSAVNMDFEFSLISETERFSHIRITDESCDFECPYVVSNVFKVLILILLYKIWLMSHCLNLIWSVICTMC